MERDEAAQVIRDCGGRVTSALSRKSSYIVYGQDAGLAKLAKADELGVRQLTEDGLLDLIRTKSGLPPVPVKMEIGMPANGTKKMTPIKSELSSNIKAEPVTVKKEKATAKLELNVKPSEAEPSVNVKKEMKTEKLSESTDKKPIKQEVIVERPMSAHQRNISSVENQAWVEKYKPTSVKQIIGQQGAASNVAKWV